MKIRIQGPLLRFRLNQKEVAKLGDGESVGCALRFPSGRALSYSVGTAADTTSVSVDFHNDSICVRLPAALTTSWAYSDQTAIEIGINPDLEVLVEKDFQCLHKSQAQDADAYPNPLS